jgi:hypothetical protein
MGKSIWTDEGTDANFQHYRTGDNWKDLRKWVDDAYFGKGLHAYLDKDFVSRLQNNDFFARLWELELAEWLQLTELKLIPTNGSGPDFCIELSSGQKIWIEAILSTPDEAMTERWKSRFGKPGEVQGFNFPKDENWLRFGSSLFTKAKKIKEKYLDKGVIAPEDVVLIAVSGFPPGALHSDIEHFMQAVLPIGDPVVHFSRDGSPLDPNVTRATHTDKAEIVKEDGTPILKQFLYPGTHFPYIDGVLFSEASNLQQLLGVWSNQFNESTNVPHVFPNHASVKTIPTDFTDNFYLHNFVDKDPAFMSMETIDPKKKLM